MKFRIFHYLLILSLLLLCVFQIPAEFIYIGNFEDEEPDLTPTGWLPYTDDDINENGWIVKGSAVVQTIINGDQTKGGVRLLIRDNILDLMDTKRPTTTTLILDVYPLDYKEGSGDVWFGMGFAVDSVKPMSNNIIVALRKNDEEKKSGLHIYAGSKGWVSEKNNFDFPVMKWSRIKVFIENQIPKSTLLIKAKVWFTSNPEPDEWLVTETIPYRIKDLSAKGIFIGTFASLGNKNPRGYKKRGNPRGAFDNFIIYKGDVSRVPYNFHSSSKSEMEPMMTLSEEQEAIELYEFACKIGPPNPNYGGFDSMMFLEMLFFREISRWDDAALNIHALIDLFPESPYTVRMGGKDGRTEDEAAIEYAEATTPFQAEEYDKSYNLFNMFLENYPNNWKHDIAQYRMIFSIYFMAFKDPDLHNKVIEKINTVIEENPGSIYIDDLFPMLIGTHIRMGNKQEARKHLDYAKKTFSYSPKLEEFDHLWMDTYLYPTVVDKEELKNTPELIDICSERAIQYFEEGNNKRAKKYISYLITYFKAVDGEDKIGENLGDFKDKAMQKSKQMHDLVEFTEAKYTWDTNREKSIKGFQRLLETNPETEIRQECIQKIMEFKASNGDSFAELKAFKEKYEKEEQK